MAVIIPSLKHSLPSTAALGLHGTGASRSGRSRNAALGLHSIRHRSYVPGRMPSTSRAPSACGSRPTCWRQRSARMATGRNAPTYLPCSTLRMRSIAAAPPLGHRSSSTRAQTSARAPCTCCSLPRLTSSPSNLAWTTSSTHRHRCCGCASRASSQRAPLSCRSASACRRPGSSCTRPLVMQAMQ